MMILLLVLIKMEEGVFANLLLHHLIPFKKILGSFEPPSLKIAAAVIAIAIMAILLLSTHVT